MLNFGNKEFRNLQEQVQKNAEDIQKFNYGGAVLSEFGIKVIGQLPSALDLPDPSLYTEDDVGDAYAIGTEPPYELYILTRPFVEGDPLQWFSIGRFPEPGEKGDKGDTGDQGIQGVRGNSITSGSGQPTVSSVYMAGDNYINTNDSTLFRYTGTNWILVGSLKGQQGAQGIQGIQGIQGVQGEQGAQGQKGDPGTSYIIMGQIANVSSLPNPATAPDGSAYLVGTSVPYTLYVLVHEPNDAWFNAGAFNDAYNVSVVNLTGSSGTMSQDDYSVLSSSKVNVIELNGEDIFRLNNETTNYLVYNMVDRYNVDHPTEKYIIVTKLTGAWVVQSEALMVSSDLQPYAKTADVASTYQPILQSGTNIKTINSTSLLGSGNITLPTGEQVAAKQDVLVSGTNIKTINSTSLLGSGNIAVQPVLVGSGTGQNIKSVGGNDLVGTGDISFKTINSTSIFGSGDIAVQPVLVDHGNNQNIKTINNQYILGSGNISVQPTLVGSGADQNIKTINSSSILGSGNIDLVTPSGFATSMRNHMKKLQLYDGYNPDNNIVSLYDGETSNQTIRLKSINRISLLASGSDNNINIGIDFDEYKVATLAGSYYTDTWRYNVKNIYQSDWEGSSLQQHPTIRFRAINNQSIIIPDGEDPIVRNISVQPVIDSSHKLAASLVSGLATVATSGSYNDLTDKPTIPSALISDVTVGGTSVVNNGVAAVPAIPTAVSDLSNDSGFITSSALSGYATESYVDTAISNINIGSVFTIKGSVATVANLPSTGNSIGDVYYVEANSSGYVWIEINNTEQWEQLGETVDLSDYAQLTDLTWTNISGKPSFATVATSGSYNDLLNKPTLFSGSYNDLSNKPTIPTQTSQLTNNSGFITSSALSGYALSSSLATVATSGSYADLSNKPTIPDEVSGTNDGTNWTSLTIGNVTKAIPSGGSGGGSSVVVDDKTIIQDSTTGEISTAIGGWKETTQGTPGVPGTTIPETYFDWITSPTNSILVFKLTGNGAPIGASFDDVQNGFNNGQVQINIIGWTDGETKDFTANASSMRDQTSVGSATNTALSAAGVTNYDTSMCLDFDISDMNYHLKLIFDSNDENIVAATFDNRQSQLEHISGSTVDSVVISFEANNIGGIPAVPGTTTYHPIDAEFVNIQQRNGDYVGGLYIDNHTLYCDAIGYSELMNMGYATESYVDTALSNFTPTNIVYSSTQPSNPTEGMIWLKPLQ